MCRVNWCNRPVTNPHHLATYCDVHAQYKIYGPNASVRPWLHYKVEKVVAGELACEICGYDPREYFPERPLKELSTLLDVDHINSDIKHTPEGEQPSNYQLVCKQCHILKSYDEGDFVSKVYR